MFSSKEWLANMWRLIKEKNLLRLTGIAGVTLCLLVLGGEIWLNFWVRASLHQGLGWGNGPQVRIKAHLNWLSIGDVLHGRVGWVKIDGENCLISNLRFARLRLENDGFTFDLPTLYKERRLALTSLRKTRVYARVTAQAFSRYLNLFYPQFKPAVEMRPGELIVSGRAEVFGNTVPAELTGKLRVVAPKDLRFYPTRLYISGHAVPQDFLRFAGAQIPLQFTLMADWPLMITAVRLGDGYALMDFKEID